MKQWRIIAGGVDLGVFLAGTADIAHGLAESAGKVRPGQEGVRIEPDHGAAAPVDWKAFTRALKKLLWGPLLRILHPLGHFGWRDGGCRVLAEANLLWIPQAMRYVLLGTHLGAPGGPLKVKHVLVRVGEHYLDGDGASTEATLLRRWRSEEDVLHARLEPDPDGRLADSEGEIPQDGELSEKLARALKRELSSMLPAGQEGLGARAAPEVQGQSEEQHRAKPGLMVPASLAGRGIQGGHRLSAAALKAEAATRAGCVRLSYCRHGKGPLVGVYRAEEAGMEPDPEMPWSTVCELHSTFVRVGTRRDAMDSASDTSNFCDACRDAAEGGSESREQDA